MFANDKWFNNHLKDIKQKAGARYTPKLNVDLPISEIFDGISKTEKFYTTIRENYGELLREFRYVTSEYEKVELQKNYDQIKKEVKALFKIIEGIKNYDTNKIPWDKIQKQTKKLHENLWEFTDKLIKERDQVKDIKTPLRKDGSYQQSHSEKFNLDIHHIYKTQELIRYFEELSSSPKAKLSNYPFLLLTGSSGTGKTHLLCDIVEQRIKNGKDVLPAFLVFGEFFSDKMDFWSQVLEQLEVENTIKTEDFLKKIDRLGEKAECRSLFIIDALNENVTHSPNFWKNNLNNIIQEIKKYPNIALIVSVRSGFENEILTEKQKTLFIHEEHQGFRFREWEAVNKFFKAYSLPLPEIPLLMPEFQNPLFLLLFCIAFEKRNKKKKNKHKKKNKQIFRGHEGATYIFESFILNATDIIAQEFEIKEGNFKSPAYRIWSEIIKEIASEMVNQNDERIPEEKLNGIIKKAYSQVDVGKFAQALESNMLIVKVPRYTKGRRGDGFDVRFPFQKFSDHLIGRYIFKKYEDEFGKQNKNLETAKKFFSKRRKLGKFLSETRNRGLIEALSIQCPEQLKGIEFIEVAPYLMKEDYLAEVAEEAFVESLIWRNPKAFSKDGKNTLKIINQNVIRTESGHRKLLNAFLSVAPIPNHPFNAERLHQHLSNFSMPKRDSWWSTFLHYQYGKKEAVDRLLQWSWSDQDKSHINCESIFLTSIALSWFLTTPNRFVRDKTTKGLVCLLQNRIHLIPHLLEKFKDVNDPYIAERLYAVAYGCVLRNQEDKINLKILAEWIYKNIFKDNKPPVHILLRDYARGVIEVALRSEIKLKIDENNINPPYQSEWLKYIPSDNEIKKYELDYKSEGFKDYYWGQNIIISSMQPEYTTIGHHMYGDFGRDVFQSGLLHWGTGGITIQHLSNLAIKMIFDEMGYNVELHGKFDRNVNYSRIDCSEHKSERIGKKYQWIAFHKIAALVSDHFEFKGDSRRHPKDNYKGPWYPHIRDIDPSFILQNDDHMKKSTTFSLWQSGDGHYDAWEKARSDEDWIKTENDLPKPEKIIQITDDKKNKWLILEGFVNWEEKTPPEHKKYDIPIREVRYILKSYIIRKKDAKKFYDKLIEISKNENFNNEKPPQSHSFYEIFIGEYPNSIAFEDARGDYKIWTKSERGSRGLKIPVVVTDDSYLNEFTLSFSHSGSVSVKLPCKWLVNKMKLHHKHLDGRFYDKKDDLITIVTSVFKESFPSAILIDKKTLIEFLDKNEYTVLWTLLGDKRIIGGYSSGNDFVGGSEISGAYKLTDKGKIIGESHTHL